MVIIIVIVIVIVMVIAIVVTLPTWWMQPPSVQSLYRLVLSVLSRFSCCCSCWGKRVCCGWCISDLNCVFHVLCRCCSIEWISSVVMLCCHIQMCCYNFGSFIGKHTINCSNDQWFPRQYRPYHILYTSQQLKGSLTNKASTNADSHVYEPWAASVGGKQQTSSHPCLRPI